MNMEIQQLFTRADAGDVAAMRELAERYMSGNGVPQDEATAFEYYIRAADAGDDEAAFIAGQMLLWDDIVPMDEVRGMALLRKAAEQGNSDAIDLLEEIKSR